MSDVSQEICAILAFTKHWCVRKTCSVPYKTFTTDPYDFS